MKKNKPNSNSTPPIASGFNFNFNFEVSKQEVSSMTEWLSTIPPCELSDNMLKIYDEMVKKNYSTEWFKFNVEDNLSSEIESFIKWNKNIIN